VIGAIALLGDQAIEYFSTLGVPLVALVREKFNLWTPAECQLCRTGMSLEDPANVEHV
jgi:hypothetical protein